MVAIFKQAPLLWKSLRFPVIAYLFARLWYSSYAAVLTGVFQQPYEGIVGRFDLFSRYFLMNWQHWDTIWYLRIALEGYGISDGRSIFPPLYPLLIRWLTALLGNPLLAAMLISTLAGLCAVTLLFVLTKEVLSTKAAKAATLILILFPTATFLFSAYTESVFLCFAIGAIYASRRDRYAIAGLLACLATLTRIQGVVLAIPLVWSAWTGSSDADQRLRRCFFASAPVIALLGFYWARGRWIDNTPIAQVYEEYWHSRFGFPGESILANLKILVESVNIYGFINWIDLGLLLLMILLVPSIIRHLPPPFWLYQIATLAILLLRVGPPQNPLQGMGRYTLLLFPGLMVLGNWARTPNRRRALLFPMLLLSMWILTAFILGLGLV